MKDLRWRGKGIVDNPCWWRSVRRSRRSRRCLVGEGGPQISQMIGGWGWSADLADAGWSRVVRRFRRFRRCLVGEGGLLVSVKRGTGWSSFA